VHAAGPGRCPSRTERRAGEAGDRGAVPRGDRCLDAVGEATAAATGRSAATDRVAAGARQARFEDLVEAAVVGRSGQRQPSAAPGERAQARGAEGACCQTTS